MRTGAITRRRIFSHVFAEDVSMEPTTLYTIGHSTHAIDEFLAMLRAYSIEALVDVRTVPKSRHNPQLSKPHELTLFARVDGTEITYPPAQATLPLA